MQRTELRDHLRIMVCRVVALAAVGGFAAAATAADPTPVMSAEQIVDRSVAVRGGLPAWNKISTIIWAGHLESERSPVPNLPFQLKEKRPGKSRFEITEPSQRSIRAFNGVGGWKMKLSPDGRPEIKPLTEQEVKFARAAPGLEGPLVDYRAKGTTVSREGTQELEGRKCYLIGLKLANGDQQTVWIDAESFLESRFDRTAVGPEGPRGVITVRYRDYKELEGLALPSVIEISGAAGAKPDRMVIERVALNPPIEDREFDSLGDTRDRTGSKAAAR